jgi:hypothetical protein
LVRNVLSCHSPIEDYGVGVRGEQAFSSKPGLIVLSQDLDNCTEMEFLDINLTKDSHILLYAIHSPFYRCILKKTILFSGFKNHYKKICENRKLERQNLESEKTQVYAQNLD